MTRIFLLRHAATDWNAEHRIQGRTDLPLAPGSVATLRRERIPREWLSPPWLTSPLVRCRQTAALLGAQHAQSSDDLVEMHWGAFEGLTLAEINAEIARLRIEPDHGLDLRPPNGESPRQVRARFARWLDTIATGEGSMVAVTHKGVIRAALSLATGWDMTSDFPRKIDWRLPQCFAWNGILRLERLNCRWKDTSLLSPERPA